MTNTLRQIYLAYHASRIEDAQSELNATTDAVKRVQLQHRIDEHTKAICRLDREAQAADRKAMSV